MSENRRPRRGLMGFVADLQQLGEHSEPAAADPYAALADAEEARPGDPEPTDVYAALSEVNPRYSGLAERTGVSPAAYARSVVARSAFARPDISPTSGGPVTGSPSATGPSEPRPDSSWALSGDVDTAPRPIIRPRAGGSAPQPPAAATSPPAAPPSQAAMPSPAAPPSQAATPSRAPRASRTATPSPTARPSRAATPSPAAEPAPDGTGSRPAAVPPPWPPLAASPVAQAAAGVVSGEIVRHGMPAVPTVVGRAEPVAAAEPIDITPGAVRTGWAPAGVGSRRRLRVGLMAGATLAALVVGGVGYAALTKPGPPIAAPDPAVPAPGTPSVQASPAGPASPPHAAGGLTHTGRPTPSRVAVTTPAAPAPVSKVPSVVRTIAPPHAVKPVRPTPTPAPPTVTDPQPGTPPTGGHPGGGGFRALSATLTPSGDGLDLYSAAIEVDNPARRPAYAWQLTLTVPGGNQVSADGAAVTQDGDQVTFRPYDGTAIAAGGSMTFTFTVNGLLPAVPYDCAIDGKPCY